MTKNEIELHRLTGKSIRCCRFALSYNHGHFGRAQKMLSDNDQEGDKRR
jgi:hypothetical protein